ncbi:MAG TPA: EscU/YscU/HrcU family type III secretion system export apparatus switch protein [Pirellulales bacterium]|nr:EscU/YscU/HrcU family type III secretion system export apparatus switch protein [Pirellulales bacterium]
MAEHDAEKSHEPTPHRREQARARGQAARSQDLSAAVLLLVGATALWLLGGSLVTTMGLVAERHLGGEPWLTADVTTVSAHLGDLAWTLAGCLLPLLGCILAAAVISNVAQVGLHFLPEQLAPDLARIDPMKGLARIFSLAAIVRLIFGLLKIALVFAVAYGCLSGERETILGLASLEPRQIGVFLVEVLLRTGMKIAFALLILALLEYGFQWWRHKQDLRMTTREIREEMKNLQGDPQMVARRRAAWRAKQAP